MKRFGFCIILLIAVSSLSAQDIKNVIMSMPESIVYGLETSEKNLLVSGLDDTTKMTVDRGRLGQVTRLAASSDFVSLKTSEAGVTEIKLLPLINDSKIICVVKTVCGPACDSHIQFYTINWVPINQNDLFPTKNKDWFLETGIDKNNQEFKNAYAALDLSPIRMKLSPSDTSLKVYYDIEKYLNADDYKKVEPFLQENPKILYWDKSSYK